MNITNCTYTYTTYVGVLDSYPVIDTSECTTVDPLDVNVNNFSTTTLDTSSSSPLHVVSDISFHDWLYVNMWLIFLMSFITIGLMYSVFKPRK